MLKVFFDTEFNGLRQDTELISIGLVTEHGEKFYAEMRSFDVESVEPFVKENVIPHCKFIGEFSKTLREHFDIVKSPEHIELFCAHTKLKYYLELWFKELLNKHTQPQVKLISDCMHYDMVLFNNIWGHAMDVPDYINYMPIDICTMFEMLCINPDISRQKFTKLDHTLHNAMNDALLIKACYEKLIKEFNSHVKRDPALRN